MGSLEKIQNQIHQRAGLLAVMTGIFQTCECEATVKSMASTLKLVLSDYPVDDFIEKMTIASMEDALKTNKVNHEEYMKEIMDTLSEILKDSSK
jgi:hypothetical protein